MPQPERNCEKCGAPFTPKQASRVGRFCSRDCYNAAGRGPRKESVAHRLRTAKGHPLTPSSGIVAVARLVLYDEIGPGSHPCHWCGETVRWIVGGGPTTPGSLLADHVDHDPTNDAPENLVPSCNQCNSHRTRRGGRTPIQADDLTVMWSGVRTRAVKRNCETCDGEFLAIPAQLAKGRGRFCSRSCARRAPRKPASG